MPDGLHLFGDEYDDDIEEGTDLYDCWPRYGQRQHPHPWYDCKRIAAEFDEEKEIAAEFFLPQHKQLGAERDDPGALSIYERHRIVERQIADKFYFEVSPLAGDLGHAETGQELHDIGVRMYSCRTSGPFGIGPHGKPVIAWDEKCGSSKLCPDEARHEAQRLFDHYAQTIADYAKTGGRVYKVWPTVPNYPAGRLREGMRHIFARWRKRIMRPVKNGRNKFGIETSLAILEVPLGKNRDWNIHLNCIVLTRGWLSYKALRAAWGCNIEITEHKRFDEKGMYGLFNEMVKYAVRAVPEKSSSKHHSEAPAFIEWTAEEIIEWYEANRRFRRTRAYGIERDENGVSTGRLLYGIKKPQRPNLLPYRWLGRVEYQPGGPYRITWREHNLADVTRQLLDWNPALDLIRGDNSTTRRTYKMATGPPS